MKKKDKKNIGIIILVLTLLIIGGIFYFGLSTIEEEFGDCKYIIEGNVCNDYTECVYSSSKDASCIKGYEDKSLDLTEYEVQYAEPQVFSSASGTKGVANCDPVEDFTFCVESYDYGIEIRIMGTPIPYVYADGRKWMVESELQVDDIVLGSYNCHGESFYAYDLDDENFNFNSDNEPIDWEEEFYAYEYSTAVYWWNYDATRVQPGVICWNDIYGSGENWIWMNWNEDFYFTNRGCENDGNCAENQYCDDSNQFFTYCDTISCSGIVFDHRCWSDTLPVVCQSAGKTTAYDCAYYLRTYINDIQGDINDLIAEIDSLEITLAEKVVIISQLEADIVDISSAIASLELTIEQNAEYINELNLTFNENVVFIQNLNLTIEEQLELISQLEISIQEKIDLIEQLYLTIEELEDILASLQNQSDTWTITLEEQNIIVADLILQVQEVKDRTFGTDDISRYIEENQVYFIGGMGLLAIVLLWYIYTRRAKK